ncbi:hypothetical protein Lepto7375DRAFT_8250 [Leptolyngbya sp. PCC 7375]|nr:hypothetical protein Lepto7375DRAFT_8250 [Leptolyngbya sp. PCC 7375]
MRTVFLVSATLISSLHLSSGLAEASSPEVSIQEDLNFTKNESTLENRGSRSVNNDIKLQSSFSTTKPIFSTSKPAVPSIVTEAKALGIPSDNVVGPRPGADLSTEDPSNVGELPQPGVGPRPGSVLSPESVGGSDTNATEDSEPIAATTSSGEVSQPTASTIAFRPGVDPTLLASVTSEEIAISPNVGPRPGDTSVIAQAENNDASSDVSETSPTTPVANLPSENVSQPILDRASVTSLPTSNAASLASSQPTFIPENFQANPVEEITLLDLEKLAYKLELEDVDFLCQTKNGSPATIAKLKDEDELLVVLWDSDFFADSGYDSETRCDQVSARFEEFFQEDLLVYITNGELNNQPVICVTDNENGDCGEGIPLHKGLLFTLKPNEDSKEKLDQLVSILKLPEVPEEQKPLKE